MSLTKTEKIVLGAAVVVALLIGYALFSKSDTFGAGTNPVQTARYSVIGTASAPLPLTTSYTAAGSASSTGRLAKGMPNVVIAGSYLPKSAGSHAYIYVERSIDNGATYKPYLILGPTATGVDVNTSGTSTTMGSPFIVPETTGFSASGTTITFSFDVSMVADYIRFSAKEFTTSTAGTLHLQSIFASQ